MAKAAVNGIEIEYEVWGQDKAQPLLLVGGLGVQLTRWPKTLCDALMAHNFKIIAYDNRDVGLSTKHDDWGPADTKAAFAQARAKEAVAAPYTLEDMAGDAAGLLDALGIETAHVIGSSNGGAIAQILAIDFPEKVATLTCIMATSGRRGLPRPEGEVAEWLTKPRNPSGTREGAMDEAVETSRINGSPQYPRPEADLRAEAAAQYDRCFYPDGNGRHLLASIASGDSRVERLSEITAPTLVIHGRDDPLIPLPGGEDIKNSIPDAELLVIDGMGHDFPDELIPRIADAVTANAGKRPPRACLF
jgi:pimeloyl-ACP methyl ester carboxylesterase